MAETVYMFSISEDFPNGKVNSDTLKYEIQESPITHALDRIDTDSVNCNIWFKEELLVIDATSTLPAIIAAHQGNAIIEESTPKTPDGVPIVRADSRPLNSEVYFTMCGDSTGIGDGPLIMWDFSNNDNEFTDSNWVPSGYKAKKISIQFNCPVWMKDGTMYFFDAPWGQNISMFVGIPAGSYYPNPAGPIPASALGLSDGKMYAYTDEDLPYQSYVMRHLMYGTCPMGDELNAEGAAMAPIPVGWKLCGIIITPESDNVSKGYASLEMYRCHTMLLPGQTLESLHS
jgi:hypothetical protein